MPVPMKYAALVLASLCARVADAFPSYAFNDAGKCDPDIMLQSSYSNADGRPMSNYVGMHGTPATGGATVQVERERTAHLTPDS